MSRKRKHNNSDNDIQTNSDKVNKELKPKSDGQKEYIRAMIEADITICIGPAGTGKTACAVGLACEHLIKDKVEHIVITRPVMETGRQGLGYLPGNMVEKIHPYLVPILDEMHIYIGKQRTDLFLQNGKIRIVPLEYMRGYNLHQSFIILDEAQNATLPQIKMLLTRIGRRSTIVMAGDIHQSDLYDEQMGLKVCLEKLHNVRDVEIIELTNKDIIRNPIISRILEKLG